MSPALRDAIARAIRRAERTRASRTSCIGCGKDHALLTVSYDGQRIGVLCRFCPWESFTTEKPKARKR